MRLSYLAFPCFALLMQSAQARASDDQIAPRLVRTGAAPAPAATQLPPSPVNGSDTCTVPDALGSATGVIPYDLTLATTGTEGQSAFTGGYCNFGCAEYGTGQVAVLTDVWFSWTAPAAGRLCLDTCPNQSDTKIGVYSGPACPTGTSALACNDDYHFSGGTTAGLLDTTLYLDVTLGQQLLIQVGQSSFNTGAPGFAGTFTLSLDRPHSQAGPFDDNAAEIDFGFGAAVGTGYLGINRYANTGDVTVVSGVQACWGFAGATGYVDGTPAYVGLWSDSVTNDGDPTDAVLVEQVSTTIQSSGTDTYVTIPFTANHTMNGMYFLGYGSVRIATNEFPLTGDNTGCNIQPNTAWKVTNAGAPANLVNIGANSAPPIRLELTCQAQGAFTGAYHSAFAIRPIVVAGPPPLGTGECFGDSAALCPCSGAGGSLVPNPGIAGHGCGNSVFPDGALLTATGVASEDLANGHAADTAVLRCENMTGPGLFIQANGLVGPIVNFNDGNLCAAAGIIRMGVSFPGGVNPPNVGTFPSTTTPVKISVAGSPVLLNGLPTPNTKHYQCWYRDAPVFCNTRGDNMSNGLAIVWQP